MIDLQKYLPLEYREEKPLLLDNGKDFDSERVTKIRDFYLNALLENTSGHEQYGFIFPLFERQPENHLFDHFFKNAAKVTIDSEMEFFYESIDKFDRDFVLQKKKPKKEDPKILGCYANGFAVELFDSVNLNDQIKKSFYTLTKDSSGAISIASKNLSLFLLDKNGTAMCMPAERIPISGNDGMIIPVSPFTKLKITFRITIIKSTPK